MLIPNFKSMPIYILASNEIEQLQTIRPDGLTDFQLMLTISGTGIFVDENNNKFELNSGDIMGFSPHIKHSYYPKDTKNVWKIRYITFGGTSLADGLFDTMGLPSTTFILKNYNIKNLKEIKELFHKILVHYIDHSIADDLVCNVLIYKLLYEIHVAYCEIESPNPKIYTPISMALSYINNNYMSRLDMLEISSNTFQSPNILNRNFKNILGMTVPQYITEFKMNMAKKLLCLNDNLTVQEVAIKVGIPSKSYFIQQFKKRFGITPGKFRKTAKEYEINKFSPISPKYSELYETQKSLPVYITNTGENLSQQNTKTSDISDEFTTYQLMLTTSGSGILVDELGIEHYIGPNSIVFTKPNYYMSYYPTDEPWSTTWVRFRGKNIAPLLSLIGYENFNIISKTQITFIGKHLGKVEYDLAYDFAKTFDEISSGSWHGSFEMVLYLSAKLYEFLTMLALAMDINREEKTQKEKLAIRAADIIQLHYMSSLLTEDIAESLDISIPTLNKIFKMYYNKTVSEHLFDVRIEQAQRRLIRYSSKSIDSIASECGFSSTSYFISCFKKVSGMTPRDFRDKYMFI